MLAACGSDEAEEDDNNLIDEELAESTENEPTQEELDAQLKEEAIEADFVAINGDEVEDGTKLYADGTVDLILEEGVIDKFSFSTDGGIYTIISLDTDTEVSEGDFVRVYGTYAGKEEGTGIPMLSVTVIEPGEKQELEELTLENGDYYVGEDIIPGEYIVSTEETGGNLIIEDAAGKTKVNEMLGTGDEYKNDIEVRLDGGDEVKIIAIKSVTFSPKE